jgi:hypothetical protein
MDQITQVPQTPHVINPLFIIQNIPPTPVKPILGSLQDVPDPNENVVKNLNNIFTMIYNLE